MSRSSRRNRRDHQLACLRIARRADPFEPSANRGNRELGRVAGDAEADPSRISGNVIDAVGRDLAKLLVLEVVHFHAFGITLRQPVAAGVAVIADQFLFLRIDGNDALASRLSHKHFGVDVFELGIAIGGAGARVGFPVDLP